MNRPMQAPRGRSLIALAAAAVAAVPLMLGSAAAAAPVPAPRPTTPLARATLANDPNFATPMATVTTSTNKKLLLGVFASRSQAAGTANANVFLMRPAGKESHTWQFAGLAKSAVQINTGGTGKMTATLPGYGFLQLTIAPHGTTTSDAACATKTRAATVSGYVALDTRSTGAHKWGKVDQQVSFGDAGTVSWSTGAMTDNCYNPDKYPCPPTSGYSWNVFSDNVHAATVMGQVTPTSATATFSRNANLSSAHQVTRYDSFTTTLAKRPSLSPNADKRTLWIGSAGSSGVVGSGKIVGTRSTTTGPCGGGSVLRTTQWNGQYTQGATPLSGRPQIFGPLTPPTSDPEFSYLVGITRYSVSAG